MSNFAIVRNIKTLPYFTDRVYPVKRHLSKERAFHVYMLQGTYASYTLDEDELILFNDKEEAQRYMSRRALAFAIR